MRGSMRSPIRMLGAAGVFWCAGCLGTHPELPAGHLPPPNAQADQLTSGLLAPTAVPEPAVLPSPRPTEGPTVTGKRPFELPRALPGAEAPPINPPRFPKDTTPAERDRAIRAVYPELTPLPPVSTLEKQPALSLADVEQQALAISPVVRRAAADVDAAYGAVIQAGLHPNPTVGWEADQWQPGNKPTNNSGQQGAYINQLIKTAGKLALAQQVAGFDYLNAQVALRRARVDVITQIRTLYFSVVVAKKGMEVNHALAEMADEVYRLQLKQLAAGEAAGYEPLQLYAQAVQARNTLVQSEATYRAGWRQLAVLLGQPDLSAAALAGSADAAPPQFDPEQARALMLENHTDLLTARNTVLQAQTNRALQYRTRVPDLQTNTVVQHDNSTGNNQFSLQLGFSLPLFDRNQGNIRQAEARVARTAADVQASENDLQTRLAEALGRYDSNRVLAENYRLRVLPNLSRAYQALIRRYQGEPDKVGFTDVVVAQQGFAQALQSYLTVLDAQWRAAVDVAALLQTDDLYHSLSHCPERPGS